MALKQFQIIKVDIDGHVNIPAKAGKNGYKKFCILTCLLPNGNSITTSVRDYHYDASTDAPQFCSVKYYAKGTEKPWDSPIPKFVEDTFNFISFSVSSKQKLVALKADAEVNKLRTARADALASMRSAFKGL